MAFFELITAFSFSIGLWLTIVLSIILMGAFLEDEQVTGTFMTAIIAIFVIGAGFFNWQESLQFITALPQHIAYIIGFLAIGVAWSIIKWVFYVRRLVQDTAKDVTRTIQQFSATNMEHENNRFKFFKSISAELNDNLRSIIVDRYDLTDFAEREKDLVVDDVLQVLYNTRFTPSRKKSVISTWIIFWPISVISTLIREFLINLIDNVIHAIRGVYNVTSAFVSKAMFGDIAFAMVKATAKHDTESQQEKK